MPTFDSDGLELAYLDESAGPSAPPILLIHGFASNKETNWVWPGWVRTLREAGRRVIALDNRGHGASAKPHDPRAYSSDRMAGDARALLDHLGIARADVMGYSMGARITAFLALQAPERVRRLVLGGLGMGLVKGVGDPEPIAQALEMEDPDAITDPLGRRFRAFAEQTKSDRRALAACMRGARQTLTEDEIGRITAPVLVAVGTRDDIAGSAEGLARLLPHGRAVAIPNRDHMLAVGDRVHKQAVLDFLAAAD